MRVIDTSQYISESDLLRLSPSDREAMYNGLDCCVALEIFEVLRTQLDDVSRATYQLSLDLRGPIMEMSMRGIRVDTARRDAVLGDFSRQHRFISDRLSELFREAFGRDFNYRSGPDMKTFFYEVLGLRPIRKRNANGQLVPTVNRDALERLQVNFWAQPVIAHIIALREIDKKIQFLKTGIDADGRMRANFNIAGTNTGRLSSSASEFGTGTNQQNIDRSLRSIFIPDPGKKFINIDLEQGDSRNLGANMWSIFLASHGPAFAGAYLDACESGDLHTTVCRMAWTDLAWPDEGSPLDEFKAIAEQIFYRQDSYRQMAKKLGHGTNFCGQPPTMAMHTKMPVSIIAEFQRRYFAAFPSIPLYHQWVQDQIAEYSFLTTLHGRRRFFFGRSEDMTTIRDAVAFTGQSMTADAVNKGMVQLWQAGKRGKPFARDTDLLCQVHDSLLLQVPEEMCDDAVPALLDICKAPLLLPGDREFIVPNEAKAGWNWGDFDKKNPEENPLGLIKWSPSGDSRKNEKPRLTIIGR